LKSQKIFVFGLQGLDHGTNEPDPGGPVSKASNCLKGATYDIKAHEKMFGSIQNNFFTNIETPSFRFHQPKKREKMRKELKGVFRNYKLNILLPRSTS
jgi:hypothetical protein